MSRRALVALLCAATMAIAGCGQAGTDKGAAERTVTVDQALGTTEFTAGAATRVVAAAGGIDNVLALGITPVAVIEVDQYRPEMPWQRGKLAGVPVIKAGAGKTIAVEEVAKYRPDLIVGDRYSLNQTSFDALRRVAPVLGSLAIHGEKAGWRAQLGVLADIVGRSDAAKQTVDDDRARVDALVAQYPGVKGKTAVVAQYIARQGQFNVVADPEDSANELFRDLGMTVPRALREGKDFRNGSIAGGRQPVSLELIPTIAANMMAIYPNGATPEQLHQVAGFNSLPQVAAGATLVGDSPTVMALNLPSAQSRAWVMDKLGPYLKAASAQPPVG